jgi:hypothetical protein
MLSARDDHGRSRWDIANAEAQADDPRPEGDPLMAYERAVWASWPLPLPDEAAMTPTVGLHGLFTAPPSGAYVGETDDPENVLSVGPEDVAAVSWNPEGWWEYRNAAGALIGSAEVAPCQWFAACDRSAVTTVAHPVLGDVPACQRCADRATADR